MINIATRPNILVGSTDLGIKLRSEFAGGIRFMRSYVGIKGDILILAKLYGSIPDMGL
jgi:hypothetical protein